MVKVSVKDVDQHDMVRQLSEFLKKSGKVKVPEWADVVKLGVHKELAPTDPDWYFTRTAAVARRLYIRSPIGVGEFSHIFGGNKRKGTMPSHFQRGSTLVARKCLQTLEAIKWVEKHQEGGRRLSRQGRKDLDRIASQIKNAKKVAASEIEEQQ